MGLSVPIEMTCHPRDDRQDRLLTPAVSRPRQLIAQVVNIAEQARTRVAIKGRLVFGEEGAIAAERARRLAEVIREENERIEKQLQEVRERSQEAARARLAVDAMKAEKEKLDAARAAAQRAAEDFAEQVKEANGETKAESREKSWDANKVAEEARLEVCDAQDRLQIKVEEEERAVANEKSRKRTSNVSPSVVPSIRRGSSRRRSRWPWRSFG